MKLKLIILFFVFAGYCASAHTDSVYVWNKWCARKDTLLLFYSGNNTIQVYCSGMKPEGFKLKSLDRNLRIGQPEISGDTMSVLAMPYAAKNNQLRLAVLDSKTSKVIKTVNFSADTIPDPEARIGSIHNSESYKKTILSQMKMRVVFPNSLYSYPYSIRQYTLKTKTANGPVSLPVNSFFLNTTILRAINETPDGSVLEFTNIKATCPECATRTLDDLKLKIKVVSFDSSTTIHVPAK